MSLRIKFRSASLEQFIERYGVDVSRGGIFIRTREPLAVGTQLRFDFQLQDAAPLLAGEGTVVWIRENDPSRAGVTPGMGVRFDKLTPSSQPVLEKILAEKGRREQAGAPPKPSPSGGMAVRRPSSTFSALDPAAARAAQATGGPPRVGGLSPLGAAAPAGAQPRTPASSVGSGPVASPSTSSPGAAPRAPQAMTGSGAHSSKLRTGENAAASPRTEGSGAFGRPRTTTGMNAQRPAPAPAALFEKPTAEDIDRALSVLTEVDGQSAAPAPVPVDFSGRTRHSTDVQPVIEAAAAATEEPARPPRHQTDAQPLVVESAPDVGDAPARRPGTGTRPLFSGTGEHRLPTQPVIPIGGEPPAEELEEEEEDGETSAWVGSGPTRAGGTQPELVAATKSSSPELPKEPAAPKEPPPVSLDQVPPKVPAAAAAPAASFAGDKASAAAPALPVPAPAVMTPSFHKPAPKPRSSAPLLIVGLLLVGGAAAAYFVTKGGGKTDGATSATAPTTAAPAEGTPAVAPTPEGAPAAAENAAPDAAVAKAPAAEAAKAAEKPAEVPAKTPTGEATPLTLRARPLGPEPAKEAPAAEAKPAAAKPAESEKPSRRKRKGGAGAASSDAPAEAAPAVADVSPSAGEGAPAGDSAAKPASTSALKITTSPAGAEVIIDGNSVGKTPYVGSDVDTNLPHSITLKKDGFETHEHMISGSDWPRPKGGVRTLKVNVKLRSAGGGEEAKPAETGGDQAPTEPGLGTTPASPKRE